MPELVESFQALKTSFDNQVKAVYSKHKEALARITTLQDDFLVSFATVEAKNNEYVKGFNELMESWQEEWAYIMADLKHKQDSFTKEINKPQAGHCAKVKEVSGHVTGCQ